MSRGQGRRTGGATALVSPIPCYCSHCTMDVLVPEAPQDIQASSPQRAALIPQQTANLSMDNQQPPKHSGPQETSKGIPRVSARYYVIFSSCHCTENHIWGQSCCGQLLQCMQIQHPSSGFPNHRGPQLSPLNASSLAVAHLWAHRLSTTWTCRPRPYHSLCFQLLLQLLAPKLANVKQDPLAAALT